MLAYNSSSASKSKIQEFEKLIFIFYFKFRTRIIAQTSCNRCESFSIGHCKPRVEALRQEQQGLTHQGCQEFCKITNNCLFYRFETYDASFPMTKYPEKEGSCRLYTEDYEARCNLYGGDQVIIPA